MADKVRNYKYDNIRFILILLVVICHLLGDVSGDNIAKFYKVIYSFHMPAFLFLSGFFARLDGRKWVANFLMPYAIFQVLYELFNYYVTHESTAVKLQFTWPRYVLWYLFVLMVYYLLIPVLSAFTGWGRYVLLAVTVAMALLVGYDTDITYPVVYRIFSFLPFFTSGYYIGHDKKLQAGVDGQRRWLLPVAFVLAVSGSIYVCNSGVTKSMLYAKHSYVEAGYTPQLKLLLMLIAAVWTLLLFLVVPNIQVPYLSGIGSRTLAIFILHGFVVKYLRYIDFFHYGEAINLIFTILVALILVLALGSRPVYKFFTNAFTGARWS